MIIDVLYGYRASVVPPRKRNPETRRYAAGVPVEVNEASGADAPVVLEMPSVAFSRASNSYVLDRLDYRAHDGKLWRPFRSGSDGLGRPLRRDAAWLAEAAATGRSPFGPGPEGAGRAEDDPAIGRWLSDDRDEMLRKVLVAARTLLLVDGMLFQETVEPLYELTTYPRPTVKFAHADETAKSWSNIFRADQLDLLLAKAAEHGDNWTPTDHNSMRVLLPEALAFPADGRALLEAAYVLEKAMRDDIAERDEAYFSAFRRLRDALRPLPIPDFLKPDQDLSMLLPAIAGAADARRTRREEHGDHALDAVEEALLRWDRQRPTEDLDICP